MEEYEKQNVVWRPITDLLKLKNNPRTISKAEMDKLVRSIKRNKKFFSANPLILSDRTGELVIIGGNQRLEAAKIIGLTEVPTILMHNPTEREERETVILDNHSNGEYDMDILADEYGDLDLEELMGNEYPEEFLKEQEPDIVEDEVPEAPEEPKSKLGDIYILGGHKVMCGDSTSVEDMEKLVGGGALVDLWLTDPPYNVDYEGGSGLKIKNDHMENGAFRQFLNDAFGVAVNVMRPGAAFYIWHADSEGYNFRGACMDNGLTVRECLVWNKNSLVLGRQDYQWKHEPCLYGWKEGTHNWYADRKQTTVIDYERPKASKEHPTMKPIGLFAYLIQNSTKEGDIVLDSFGGSGTTLIACEQLNRNALIMELDPHYVDVIIERWEKFTGKKAKLISKGE